jgi:crossover junction endodeoxyribonuclease RuvC
MFVLGIDPGLTTTGYGVVGRFPALKPVAAGVIRTRVEDTVAVRLRDLYDSLLGLIQEHQPEVMAIEQVFTNVNRQTAIAVGRAAGVAILAAAQSGMTVFEYTPTAVKSAVTGDGAAGKRAVQTMVARRLNLKSTPQPADAADALAVAICHLQSLQVPAGVLR